jgi:cytochrome oxidase assembly protein ShyY1
MIYPRAWSRLISYVPASITLGLGLWQLDRRREKIEQLNDCREQVALPPLDESIFSQDRGTLETQRYRLVRLQGEWVHHETRLVGPRPCPRGDQGAQASAADPYGYFVVTPFRVAGTEQPNVPQLDGGLINWPVLVNRGWIPRLEVNEYWQRVRQAEENLTGHVEHQNSLIAILQKTERSTFFIPRNHPAEHKWFRLDPTDLGGELLLAELAEPASTIPGETAQNDPLHDLYVSRPLTAELCQFYISPETHAGYSMTWFTLSAALGFLGWYRNRRLLLDKR